MLHIYYINSQTRSCPELLLTANSIICVKISQILRNTFEDVERSKAKSFQIAPLFLSAGTAYVIYTV